MKVFVTGATGTIGQAVAEKLQAGGHSVLGLARSDEAAATLAAENIEVHRGDLYDPESLRAGARQAEAVVHMASPSLREISDFEKVAHIWRQTLTVFAEELAGSGKRFIATSGTAVYNDTGEQVVDETTPIPASSPMAFIAGLENIILEAAAEEVHSIVIRPPLVYGRGRSVPVLNLLENIRRLGHGLYVPGMDIYNAAVHVDDLADLYVQALALSRPGELYNGVGEIVSTKAVVEAAVVAAEVEAPLQAATAAEMQQLGFMGHYLVSNGRISAEKARSRLGWEPQRLSVLEDLRYGSYRPEAARINPAEVV